MDVKSDAAQNHRFTLWKTCPW